MSVATKAPIHQTGAAAALTPLLRPAAGIASVAAVGIISLAALGLMLKSLVRDIKK